MRFAFLAASLVSSAALLSTSANAGERSFVYTHESRVLAPGESELRPWSTFRAGRSRYYSAIDGRLQLAHGVAPGLQLALYWNFSTETKDVVQDSLTRELQRVTSSELASVSGELSYQLSDSAADLLGSALYLQTSLGPRQSALTAKVILDRSVGKWLLAANVGADLVFAPVRNPEGSELETALVLEPALAAGYALPHGVSLGLELRAPLGVAGQADSATLFGGPVARFAGQNCWAALGVQPQLLAFSGQSADSRLDLNDHERLEVRLLAGFRL
jgi:hypothetical protein